MNRLWDGIRVHLTQIDQGNRCQFSCKNRTNSSRRNKHLRHKKYGILPLQELQAAADAAEEAAWAALQEEEDDAGAAWEQEESAEDWAYYVGVKDDSWSFGF
jgi:hypothetical protein